MKNIPDSIYRQIVLISDEVKKNLRKKGVVVPIKNDDGSVSVGVFRIIKSDTSYSVVDHTGEPVVERINLPQSAVLIANSLALGKFKDNRIIDLDQKYGYAVFDEMLHQRAVENSKKKSLEYFDLMLTKCLIAKSKKEAHKTELIRSYEKLIKLV